MLSLRGWIGNHIVRLSQQIVLKETVRSEYISARLISKVAVPFLVGLFTGFVSGLVGLGGAELRMPFLLYLMEIPLREMIVLNLLVSLVTSSSNFLIRWESGFLATSDLPLSLSMVLGSLGGGYFGAVISHRVSAKELKGLLSAILFAVITKLVIELFTESDPTRVFPDNFELPIAALFGFGIGLIAGAIGVAGGEYRIPTLMYLFGYPIKIAGTISQLVSIPTMIPSILKHNHYRVIGRETIRIALMMGLGSLVGVILSGVFLVSIPSLYMKALLISILAYTVVRLLGDLKTIPQ